MRTIGMKVKNAPNEEKADLKKVDEEKTNLKKVDEKK